MGRTLTLLAAVILLPSATLAACASKSDHPPVLDECGAAGCGSAAGSGGTSSGGTSSSDTDGGSTGSAADEAGATSDDASTGIDAGLGLADSGFGGGLFD
jgi:hypothetical protein